MSYPLLSLVEACPPGFRYCSPLARRDVRRRPFALFAMTRESAEHALLPFGEGIAGIIVTLAPEHTWSQCGPLLYHLGALSEFSPHLDRLLLPHLELLAAQQQAVGLNKEQSFELARAHEERRRRKEEFAQVRENLLAEIADRKQAQSQLYATTETLRQIIDTIPHFVFWKGTDLTYMGCNERFAYTAGLASADEIVGKNDFEFTWREQADLYRSIDRRVIEQDTPLLNFTEPQSRPDGSSIWVETSKIPLHGPDGRVIGILGVYQDITERRQNEESRNRTLTFIATLLEQSPMGICVFSGDTGLCVQANRAAADMFGMTSDRFLGQSFRDLAVWLETGLCPLAESVLNDGVARRAEVEIPDSLDRGKTVVCFLSRFTVEEASHLLIIVQDVTEEKRLLEENERIEGQMLHVQKLESLGVLAGGIAHDFNNILMAILGNAELALMQLDASSPACTNLRHIEQASRRAAELARQMLAYSGKGQFVVEMVSLNTVIEEMAHMLDVSITKKATLHFNLARNLPSIEADATQIRQIIMNLVINASESLEEKNGVITIATGSMNCDRCYLSGMWIDDRLPEGGYVVLDISDTGCGMDEDTISKIFDPFFTTKFTGRGLGMAAVLGIVRAHKGAIKVYSEKGAGTTFKILLPASGKAAVVGPQAATQPLQGLRQGAGTVLLVDDEAAIRSLGHEMLRMLGYNVLMADNGCDAIEIFSQNSDAIVCVVLDLSMPRMDGEETFVELRRIKPDVRVLMSSGYDEMEVSRKFLVESRTGFIQKPYTMAELGCKLRDLIGIPPPEA